MRRLELEPDESNTLKQVLESDVEQLLLEEARTDRREFRRLLKEKEECLQKILQKLESEHEPAVVEELEPVVW